MEIRAAASWGVSQVTLVPGELTRGSAVHVSPELHGVVTNFPPTHCAKPPLTQACSPSSGHIKSARIRRNKPNHTPVQGLSAVNDANFWLSACASLPFWTAKPFEPDAGGVGEEDAEEVAGGEDEEPAGEGVFDGVEEVGGGFCVLPLPDPVFEGMPGDDTWSTSCVPSGIGPDG